MSQSKLVVETWNTTKRGKNAYANVASDQVDYERACVHQPETKLYVF